MKKSILTFVIVLFSILIFILVFYPKTVKKAVIDNSTLKNITEESKVIAPVFSKGSAALNGLNRLSEDSSKGFSEVPKELKFSHVEYDEKTKLAKIFARYEGNKEQLGSFQESKMLLQIFQTVKSNIPEAEQFSLIFEGESPFTELKADGSFKIDGENLILVGD